MRKSYEPSLIIDSKSSNYQRINAKLKQKTKTATTIIPTNDVTNNPNSNDNNSNSKIDLNGVSYKNSIDSRVRKNSHNILNKLGVKEEENINH